MSRTDFEKWAFDYGSPLYGVDIDKNKRGEYKQPCLQSAYEGYQAATTRMETELKEAFQNMESMKQTHDTLIKKLQQSEDGWQEAKEDAKHWEQQYMQASHKLELLDSPEMVEAVAVAINLDWKRQFDGQPISGDPYDSTSWTATGRVTNISELAQAALSTIKNKLGV